MLDKIRNFAEEYDEELKTVAVCAGTAVAYVALCGAIYYVCGKAWARGVLAAAATAVVA